MQGYQQGDVILERVEALPEGAKKIKPSGRGWVLAEGEHTGHAHTMAAEYGELVERDGVLYLSVTEPAPLIHEEHHTQTIAPGTYRIRRVVEVDPFENEIRTVAD